MGSREEWEIELERRKLLQEKMVTERQKERFIKEIRSGLGEEILKEPNKIQKPPTIWVKLKRLLGWN